MSRMQAFTTFLLESLPKFLMAEPIIYFVAIGLLVLVIGLIHRLLYLGRSR